MAQGGNTITLSLAGLGAILGVVATGWAAWNSARLSAQQHFDEYQLGVFDNVMGALDKPDAERLYAVQLLVLSLPSQEELSRGQISLREPLSVLLCERANLAGEGTSVQRVCAELPTAVPETQETEATQVAQAPSSAAGALVQAPPPASSSTPTTTPAPRPDAGETTPPPQQQASAEDFGSRSSRMTQVGALWSVDIFYCEGDAAAQQRAETVFGILSAEAREPRPDAGITLGRIRSRPLPTDLNRAAGYQVASDEVRAEPGEVEAGAALRALIHARSGPALNQLEATTSTPFYLSVFVCGAPVRATPRNIPRSPSRAVRG